MFKALKAVSSFLAFEVAARVLVVLFALLIVVAGAIVPFRILNFLEKGSEFFNNKKG